MNPQEPEVIVIEDSEDEAEAQEDQDPVDEEQVAPHGQEVIIVDDSSNDDDDEPMNDFSVWVDPYANKTDGDWDHFPSGTGLTVGEIFFNKSMFYTPSFGETLFLQGMNQN
jgi:hypothetical protein